MGLFRQKGERGSCGDLHPGDFGLLRHPGRRHSPGDLGGNAAGSNSFKKQNPVMGGRRRGLAGADGPGKQRKPKFEQWLRENGFNYKQNDAANYGFLLNELRGAPRPPASERSQTERANLETATSEFMRVFERPAAAASRSRGTVFGLAKLALG